MSRADWSFLEHLLEEGQEYSTGVGRVWLTVLFLFRMLALGTAAGPAWDDEQADFVCNTLQPGCTAVCYDTAFPISHFRYFILQIIFVSTPTVFYFGYVAIRTRRDKAELGSRKIVVVQWGEEKSDVAEDKPAPHNHLPTVDSRSKEPPQLKGRLLCAYTFSIVLKVILEVGFIVGLWLLYDGFTISPKFECSTAPCPYTVDCFISRPTEKTIFTFYSQGIAAVSLLLNIVELLHLLQLAVTHQLEKRYSSEDYLSFRKLEREANIAGAPLSEKAGGYSDIQDSGGGVPSLVGVASVASTDLPSYSNCIRMVRVSYSRRAGGPRATSGGRKQQKHYV